MVWRVALFGLMISGIAGSVLWAQSSFVSEITVPGYGKADLAAIVSAPRDNFFDAFFMVVANDNSTNNRLLRAKFTHQGDLIDAEWLGDEGGQSGGYYVADLANVEPLHPMRAPGKFMIAVSGYPGWLGIYDRFAPETSWRVIYPLHTAVVGRPSLGYPDQRVIVALAWFGYWAIYVLAENGTVLRAFRFTNQTFPTLGVAEEHFWTFCCRYSRHILTYDWASGNFLLATGASFPNATNIGSIHYMIYAFTAEGEVQWVLALAIGLGGEYQVRGDKVGILPLNDGTAVMYYTVSNRVHLCRIDTRTGQLLSAVIWQAPAYIGAGIKKLRLIPTQNYGVLLGYVGDKFGAVRDRDWSGWHVSVPGARLRELAAGAGFRPLWIAGGTKWQDDDPAAVLAVFEPDTWAEFPFLFYPCFETTQAPEVLPLQSVLAENGSATTQAITVSPQSAPFSVRPAALQVQRVCEVSECVPSNGDVNGDGCVDDADLLEVLFQFGSTDPTPADVNCDGVVDDADLLIVLFNFGNGC